jgi:phosphoheptose isomerase
MTEMESNFDSFTTYRAAVNRALGELDDFAINSISQILINTFTAGKTVFLIGNGGSASIVEHAYCDLLKTVQMNLMSEIETWTPNIRVLTSPSSLVTAIANDIDFNRVFSWQIDSFMNQGDCLLAVSSSGNSMNILNAAKSARSKGGIVIGFCGFENPKLLELSDFSIHVKASNYGIVEDVHAICFHAMTQRIISLLR